MELDVKEENVVEGTVHDNVEQEVEITEEEVVEKDLVEKKRRRMNTVRVVILLLVAFVFGVWLVYNYSPPFNDTVTHFSDEGPRVGNNIYGYIDVPEGFVVMGSFNPQNTNYVGGKDGVAEGVQLKSEDGTMYIVVSLVTSDRERDDYVGFGEDRYCFYQNKNYYYDGFDVFSSMTEDLIDKKILEVENDGLALTGTSGLICGMRGVVVEWSGRIFEEEYRYQTFLLENPEHKGVFHCVTAAYTGANEECVEYAKKFSLSP